MKNKILDNLSFLVIALTLVLVVLFKDDFKVLLFIVSCGVFLYGILACLGKNRYGALCLGAGVSLFVTMIFYVNKVLDRPDCITFFIASTMMLVCLVSYVFMIINEKEIFKIYSTSVLGTVVDLEKNPNTKKEYYSPIYVYTIKNREYRVGLPYYINRNIPKIGDKTKIYVDPKDNLNVYFDKNLFNKIRYWGTGIVLIVVSVGIIISLFV